MSRFLLALLTIVLVGYAPSNAQEPGDIKSSELVASAKAFVDLLAVKDFSNAGKSFDDTMKRVLPPEKLRETWNTLITQAGAFKRQVSTRTEEQSGHNVVFVTCEFEKAAVNVKVVFDQARRIAGLFFTPAETVTEYTPPGYVKPNAFREKDVTVGTGEWALPGTLTLPAERGSFPAVVLVHGSGPEDRDETIGPNKPFRDLAWGLASKGIAVLRYEKRTKQHGQKMGSLKRLTVREESVDDALAAVALLRMTEGIDAKRIFVLGHSMGGTLVPRIGKADPKIAGFIVLAGSARPLEDVLPEQYTYIFSLDGVISPEEQAQLEEIKTQSAKVKNLKPSEVDSVTGPFGVPASYWLDLQGYDPAYAAKALEQPMLILQGERDYQVTMEDFQRWRTALSSRRNVSFQSYPKLNHLFGEGNGKAVPAEYNLPGHVAEVVITDIANWVMNLSGVHKDIKPGASPVWSVGRTDAPVSVEVFNDYQCPPCARFNEELKNINATYKGNVRIVFRNYPLTAIHPNTLAAARAAEAAGLQGSFIEMINLLYDEQRQWAMSKNARQRFLSYARKLNLNPRRFTRDMDGGEVSDRIRLDIERAHSLEVTGTPTVLVNGKMLSAQTDVHQAIKDELNRASWLY